MTVLISIGVIALFFIIPFFVGNIYALVFRKKEQGIATSYFSGLAIVYAGLLALQMIFVKFGFNFVKASKAYHIYFLTLGVLGFVCLIIRVMRKQVPKADIVWTKKAWWIYAIIVLQGVLYIGLKNPYFENNSLWELAKITMQSGTIYEYNAFSNLQTVAGFPLSNKLMFLPVLYAYVSSVFGINVAWIVNYIMPIVTFVSFYLIMILWIQKLAGEEKMKWTRLLVFMICIVQLGDAWSHSTAFRVLHTGYTGEAIFFGVLFAYCLYEIKNGCYLIGAVSLLSFPGLVKYDALIVFIKEFGTYWKEMAYYSGFTVLFILAVVLFVNRSKKISSHLLNLNLTICLEFVRMWDKTVGVEEKRWRKLVNGAVLTTVLLLCGNITIVSEATEWRSNVYGATETEYELLEELSAQVAGGEKISVLAHDNINKWVGRLDFPIETIVGYDYAHNATDWYSYEEYDDEHVQAWEIVHMPDRLLAEIDEVTDRFEPDYIVLERITQVLPIRDNPNYDCVIEGRDYLVYSVDKK